MPLLLRDYSVGKSSEGNDAYHPLLFLKCLLLQQWFHIDSGPELETQINDRSSFKKFLELPMDELAPDHSTFSRFRSRLSKETMKAINHELLSQFASRGLAINEGIAIDARLVQSAGHPNIRKLLKYISTYPSYQIFKEISRPKAIFSTRRKGVEKLIAYALFLMRRLSPYRPTCVAMEKICEDTRDWTWFRNF